MGQPAILQVGTEHRFLAFFCNLQKPVCPYYQSVLKEGERVESKLQDKKIHIQVYLHSCQMGKKRPLLEVKGLWQPEV